MNLPDPVKQVIKALKEKSPRTFISIIRATDYDLTPISDAMDFLKKIDLLITQCSVSDYIEFKPKNPNYRTPIYYSLIDDYEIRIRMYEETKEKMKLLNELENIILSEEKPVKVSYNTYRHLIKNGVHVDLKMPERPIFGKLT